MALVGWIEQPDLNYAAIVIADEDSGDTLEIQRSLVFDGQDVSLAMDTYCLVRSGAAHYGGVEFYEIGDSFVEFSLSSEAAEALELPSSFQIPGDAEGAAILRRRLPGLLR